METPLYDGMFVGKDVDGDTPVQYPYIGELNRTLEAIAQIENAGCSDTMEMLLSHALDKVLRIFDLTLEVVERARKEAGTYTFDIAHINHDVMKKIIEESQSLKREE